MFYDFAKGKKIFVMHVALALSARSVRQLDALTRGV
jgi:hypothetical protein